MEAEEQHEEKKVIPITSPIKRTTMEKLGPSLPIGTIDPATGALNKTMSWRNWNMKTEKALGRLRDDHRNQNQARFAAMVVAFLYELVGAQTFEGDAGKIKKDMITIGQMWMGDILYAYIWLRKEFVSSTFDMDCTCPSCLNKFIFRAELDTVTVRTVDTIEDAYWEYRLKHPFEVRGNMIKGFKAGPARWLGLEKGASTGLLDTGGTKAELIIASIHDVIGTELKSPLTDHELESLSKYDIEAFTGMIAENHVGPDMSIEGKCKRCKGDFNMSIDWTYDNFFAVSGQSAQQTS